MVWTLLVASVIYLGTNAFAQTSKAELIGHWRATTIQFESPIDTHLVLRGDGTVEVWEVTAGGRGEKTTGRWSVDGKTLVLDGTARPFTFHEGKLVYPNIENSRVFYERIE